MNIEDVRRQFNKYHLIDMLHKLSDLSIEITNSYNDEENKHFNIKTVKYSYRFSPDKMKEQSYLLPNWIIIDVAYFVTKYSSSVFSKKDFDENDFIKIIHSYINYTPVPRFNNDDFMLYVYGFGGEQDKFQLPKKIKENYCRENFILHNFYSQDKMNEAIYEEIGVSSKKLSLILLYLFSASSISKDVLSLSPNCKDFSYEDICKVVRYYSIRLDEIKNSKLGRQLFYTKPFIESSEGVFFSINSYLIYHIFQNSNLWVIRNHYNGLKSNEFLDLFGTLFENYIEYILNIYIEKNTFFKISRRKEKSADYKIVMGDYSLIVEAKSGLLGLQAKQQESDIEFTKKYIDEHLRKAIIQLNQSELDFNDGKHIKIILTYEDYFKSELLQEVFKTIDCVKDDGLFWLVNISEFENLLYLYENQNELFIEVMEEKIQCEKVRSLDGRDFEQLLERKGIKENIHIKQDKYKRYYTEVEGLLQTNLKNNDIN